jgi:hypothetical protein
VIIAERDAFEITWRTANSFSIPKRNIMGRLAVKDEVGGLFGRK